MSSIRVMGLVLALGLSSQAVAEDEQHTFGVGELYNETRQPWYPCGTNPVSAAAEICSVTMPNGQPRRFSYSNPSRASSPRGGNQCGYSVYTFICYGLPATLPGRRHEFVIGEHGATYGCNTNPDDVARSFCTTHGPGGGIAPYTLRRTKTFDGNACGYNSYVAECRAGIGPLVR